MKGLTWVPATPEWRQTCLQELRLQTQNFNSWLITDQWVEEDMQIGLPRYYAFSKGIFPGVCENTIPWPSTGVGYRYNQEQVIKDSVQHLLTCGGCLLEAPTGWGKLLSGLRIAEKLGQKTLVLVNKDDLLEQWKNSFKDFFGESAGHVQGNKVECNSPLVVATVQTLYSRMYQLPESFWQQFGTVVIDECHRMPSETFTQVISMLPAKYRLGLSATWRRKDGLEPLWENHISNRMTKGVKDDIKLKYRQVVYDGMSDRDFYFRGELSHVHCLNALARSEGYTQYCEKLIRDLVNAKRKVLVVSHRIEQLETLYSRMSDMKIGVYTGKFHGKTLKKAEIEQAKEADLIFGTYGKIGEGSDIPKLDTLVMITPCTDPEQVVGRVARAYPGKKTAWIVDVVVSTGYNWALARKREKHYERLNMEKF